MYRYKNRRASTVKPGWYVVRQESVDGNQVDLKGLVTGPFEWKEDVVEEWKQYEDRKELTRVKIGPDGRVIQSTYGNIKNRRAQRFNQDGSGMGDMPQGLRRNQNPEPCEDGSGNGAGEGQYRYTQDGSGNGSGKGVGQPNGLRRNKNPEPCPESGPGYGAGEGRGKGKHRLQESFKASEDENQKIEAHGLKGMKSIPWRKIFKNQEALEKWVEENDAEILGTRKVSAIRRAAQTYNVWVERNGEWSVLNKAPYENMDEAADLGEDALKKIPSVTDYEVLESGMVPFKSAQRSNKVANYAIENNSGQWWTGRGWGVEQAREVYESIDDFPNCIDDLDLEVFATPDQGGFLDARYFFEDEQDAEAGVHDIGKRTARRKKSFYTPIR